MGLASLLFRSYSSDHAAPHPIPIPAFSSQQPNGYAYQPPHAQKSHHKHAFAPMTGYDTSICLRVYAMHSHMCPRKPRMPPITPAPTTGFLLIHSIHNRKIHRLVHASSPRRKVRHLAPLAFHFQRAIWSDAGNNPSRLTYPCGASVGPVLMRGSVKSIR